MDQIMALSLDDRDFIKANSLPANVFVHDLDNTKDAISDLLPTFQIHPVAQRLRSPYRPVNRELALIYARLDADDFDLSSFTPLTTLITDKADDAEIWQAVLDLITSLSRTSPKPLKSIPPSFNGTPRTYSSASFRDSVQKRKEIEEPLRHELADYTYTNVQGFFAKYFESTPWSEDCDQLLTSVKKDEALHSFLNKAQPDENEVWEWLDNFQNKYLTTARGVYHRAKSKADIEDSQGQRQFDIFLKNRDASMKEPHSARDIHVVGELTKSPKKDVWRKKYLQIATYVRDIFAAQPTRWFVHGFLMFGCQMELWVFDRSGAYSSETFDVREHTERLITVITGYAMMSDCELGVSPFVQHHKSGTSVTIIDAMGKDRDLQLEPTPFVSQPAIVSRGTTCYRTLDGKNVVKMSWRPDKLCSEIDLLTIAQRVKGIPQLVGSRDVTTIEKLRSNLGIGTKRDLGNGGPQRSTDSPASSITSQSTHAMAQLDMSGNKRASDSTDEPLSKKRRSSQASHLRREVKAKSVGSKTPKQSFAVKSLSSPERSSYRNRVLTCLVIAPAGRPLQHFGSVLEVLEAFRDAIKAHRSLFIEWKILHRDISMNNIILTDPAQNDGCTGMLIDLDLAVKVGKDGKNETSETKTMTGTLEYIAIQILENQIAKKTVGIEHTYRHDLESFFYVLLSLCIRYGWPPDAIPKSYPLRTWYEGGIQQNYDAKLAKIGRGFEAAVLDNFSPTFDSLKPLARKLRKILFTEGGLYVETPEDPPAFYDTIIEAFDTAIRDSKCRQRGLRSRHTLKEVSYKEKVVRAKGTAGEKVTFINGRRRYREYDELSNIQTKRRRRG